MSTTCKSLLAMAGVTAGIASAVVAPAPAHATTTPEAGPSARELSEPKSLDAPQATGATAAGNCRSWGDLTLDNVVVRLPTLTRNRDVYCELRRGDVNNDAVYKLQDALNLCYGQGLARDGHFGIETHKAVKNVQAFHRQGVTGVYNYSPLGRVMFWPAYDKADGDWTGRCAVV